MNEIEIDGIRYQRIQPLDTYNWSLTHFGKLDFNPTVYCLIAGIFGVALWMVIDLTFQIHVTFKRYRGAYYWSMNCTVFGIACHAISFITKLFFHLSTPAQLGTTVVAKLGWVMNTTGFSFVLWSRMNLVVQNPMVLTCALTAIIVDGFLFHTPVVVFSFGMSTPDYAFWFDKMQIVERIQVVGFLLQELALSTVYTWTAAELLRHRATQVHRNLFIALLFAQVFTFLADLAMVVLDYVDMFTLKASLHPFIFAIKLKIEFIVLNQLTCLVQPNSDFFVYLGDPTYHKHNESKRKRPRSPRGEFSQGPDEKTQIQCLRCRSLSDDACSRNSSADSEAIVTPRQVSFQADLRRPRAQLLQDVGALVPLKPSLTNEVEDQGDRILVNLERQYLGRSGR